MDIDALLALYDTEKPLAEASTIPGPWYTDPRVLELEKASVFASSWQFVARLDQLAKQGQYVTADVAGEPVVVVRDASGLRAFYNVCRHHATLVMAKPEGECSVLRCPYHGWTYGLDGRLKAAPDMGPELDKSKVGLAPIRVEAWENFVFVTLDPAAPGLAAFLGGLPAQVAPLGTSKLKFFERRVYDFKCNWKVYVDNYLDGGYHVPVLHKSLAAVIDYVGYTIENGERFVLQKAPLKSGSDLRRGRDAFYWWLYPNFMLNWYEGVMDVNLVLPLGHDRTRVVFDFYFDDVSPGARERNKASVDLGERIQHEDQDISESVQKGLSSRSYAAGRLSVRREGGEHLFHRLVAGDLAAARRALRTNPRS